MICIANELLVQLFVWFKLNPVVTCSIYHFFFFFFFFKHFRFGFCVCFLDDSADEVLLKPTGAQLTVEFLEEHSFSVPVMVLRRDGLGMTLPPSSFCVSDVEHHIGKFGCLNLCRSQDYCTGKGWNGQFWFCIRWQQLWWCLFSRLFHLMEL